MTGLSDVHTKNTLSIYTNPSNDGIFNLSKTVDWKVYSIFGIELKTGKGSEVDISDCAKGIYLIKMGDAIQRVVRNSCTNI